MTTKQEILEQIKILQAKADGLADDKPNVGRVALNSEEVRYQLFSDWYIIPCKYQGSRVLEQGNYFTSLKAAQLESKRRELVQKMRIAADEAGGVDWNNLLEYKYHPCYDFEREDVFISYRYHSRSCQLPHFPDRGSLEHFLADLTKHEERLLICGLD